MDPHFEDVGTQVHARFAGGVVVVNCKSALAAHLLRFDLYRAAFADSAAGALLRRNASLPAMLEFLKVHLDGETVDPGMVIVPADDSAHPKEICRQ
jgi:hypothetical protein